MITYFGYGSNINLISLRAKGVVPLSSLRGTLKGWKLAFNVQHWFRHEGGVGNIIPTSMKLTGLKDWSINSLMNIWPRWMPWRLMASGTTGYWLM